MQSSHREIPVMVRCLILLLVLLGVGSSRVHAQSLSPLPIRWQKNFGGTLTDLPRTLVRAADGGYLLGGYSRSIGGAFDRQSTNYGFMDFWVVRTDKDGNKVWERSYGTSSWDDMTAAVALSDGGFLLGGLSRASDGTKASPVY